MSDIAIKSSRRKYCVPEQDKVRDFQSTRAPCDSARMNERGIDAVSVVVALAGVKFVSHCIGRG